MQGSISEGSSEATCVLLSDRHVFGKNVTNRTIMCVSMVSLRWQEQAKKLVNLKIADPSVRIRNPDQLGPRT